MLHPGYALSISPVSLSNESLPGFFDVRLRERYVPWPDSSHILNSRY